LREQKDGGREKTTPQAAAPPAPLTRGAAKSVLPCQAPSSEGAYFIERIWDLPRPLPPSGREVDFCESIKTEGEKKLPLRRLRRQRP